MIYANVTPPSERVPVVLSPVRVDVYPHDEALAPFGATRLAALAVLDDRLYLSLDAVPDHEDLQAEGEAGREALAAATRWWRMVRADSPGDFSWVYGPAPISGSPSILDGDDLHRLCAAHHIDLSLLDYVLTRMAQHRWSTGWGELPIPLPPYPKALVSHQIPLFPAIVHAGALEVDPETGVATPMEPT